MSSVLFVYEREMASITIARSQYSKILDNPNSKVIFKKNTLVTENDIENADCVFFLRANNYLSMKIARRAFECGCFIIFEMDDELFALPKNVPSIPWKKTALKKVLETSDIMLSASPYMLNKYAPQTRTGKGYREDTIIFEEEIASIPDPIIQNPVKIVFAAGANHEEIFQKLVQPTLKLLDQRFGDGISFDFVGVHPDLDIEEYSFKISFHQSMPIEEYRKFMIEQRYDIGLAPLNDDYFSACKYFNKYLEYTRVGTVGIYSNVEPYTYVVKDEVNGFLANNTIDSWYECIEKAVENVSLRHQCITNAKEHIKTEFSFDGIKNRILSDVPEFELEREKNTKCKSLVGAKIVYRVYRILDKLYLTWFYFKQGGLKLVINKIRNHL